MSLLLGRTDWKLTRDKDGHRDYKLKWLIQAGDTDDGPTSILFTPGLPSVGSFWNFGNDTDTFAYCWPNAEVQPVITQERGLYWTLEQTFSTRPISRCQDNQIENPLDEPPSISGTFFKYTEEAQFDRHGKAIKNSAHEQFRGSEVEFDKNRPTICIEFNSLYLPLALFCSMVDMVNDAPLWDLAERCIKLSNVAWQRKIFGTCSYYYTIRYEFDVSFTTFDRRLVDQGKKCLIGWSPGAGVLEAERIDPNAIDSETGEAYKLNPKRFEQYKDINGENTLCFLDGSGRPLANGEDPVEIVVERYDEGNMLALGVPSVLIL